MKKNNLTKGNNPNVWDVNRDLFNKIVKQHLGKNVCFGEMCLPSINYSPKEIPAKTRKEAEQRLAKVVLEVVKSTKERMEQISECQSCKNFDKCFKISLLGVVKNATRSI